MNDLYRYRDQANGETIAKIISCDNEYVYYDFVKVKGKKMNYWPLIHYSLKHDAFERLYEPVTIPVTEGTYR